MQRKNLTFAFFILVLTQNIFVSNLMADTVNNEFYAHVISRVNINDIAYDVFVQDEFVYITGNEGFQIIDISNINRPQKIGYFSTNESIFGIFVKNNLAFVANCEKGFLTVDITDKENPKLLDHYYDGGKAISVVVEEDIVYLADNHLGLDIYNISNPNNIQKIGSFNNGGQAISVVIKNNVAFIADAVQGVEILNISNPAAPNLISTIPNTYGAWDCYINDEIICIPSETFGGIKIANISDLKNPQVISQFHDGGESNNVAGNGSLVFIADNIDGVELLNISNPLLPVEVGQYNTKDIAHSVFYNGKYVFLAEAAKGLTILEFNYEKSFIANFWWIIVIGLVGLLSISIAIFVRFYKRKKQ